MNLTRTQLDHPKKDNQNARNYNNRTGIQIKQRNNAISRRNPEMKPDVSCFSVFYLRFLTWGLEMLQPMFHSINIMEMKYK
jgi:hypothetical protein